MSEYTTCALCNKNLKPKDSVLKHYMMHTEVMAFILALHQRSVTYKEFEDWHINKQKNKSEESKN